MYASVDRFRVVEHFQTRAKEFEPTPISLISEANWYY